MVLEEVVIDSYCEQTQLNGSMKNLSEEYSSPIKQFEPKMWKKYLFCRARGNLISEFSEVSCGYELKIHKIQKKKVKLVNMVKIPDLQETLESLKDGKSLIMFSLYSTKMTIALLTNLSQINIIHISSLKWNPTPELEIMLFRLNSRYLMHDHMIIVHGSYIYKLEYATEKITEIAKLDTLSGRPLVHSHLRNSEIPHKDAQEFTIGPQSIFKSNPSSDTFYLITRRRGKDREIIVRKFKETAQSKFEESIHGTIFIHTYCPAYQASFHAIGKHLLVRYQMNKKVTMLHLYDISTLQLKATFNCGIVNHQLSGATGLPILTIRGVDYVIYGSDRLYAGDRVLLMAAIHRGRLYGVTPSTTIPAKYFESYFYDVVCRGSAIVVGYNDQSALIRDIRIVKFN